MRGNGMDDGVVSFVMAEGWAPTPAALAPVPVRLTACRLLIT